MNRVYKTEGIVIKRKNFGEADKILTLFSKHYGKIHLIAKGIRKATSRKAGSLELFNNVRVILAKGKNFDIISEVQLINSFPFKKRSLSKIGTAYYFCELVDKLTAEGQINKEVFDLLKNYLKKIETANLPKLIQSFEKHLLEVLGFGIPLEMKNKDLKPYIEALIEKRIKTLRIINIK